MINLRVFLQTLACSLLFVGSVSAAEYKEAVVKGVQKSKFVFEVDGKEIQISPGSIAWKAYDIKGRQLTEFGQNFRVMKPGNVVNVVTAIIRGTEYVQEIHLVKGELAELGKPKTTTGGKDPAPGRRPALEQATYTGATIKSVDGNKVVLVVEDKEISVIASGAMKAFDRDGNKLSGKGQNVRVLKPGNRVDVTIFKGNRDVPVIREIHLAKGDLVEAK